MKIAIEQQGGFTGLRLRQEADDADLSLEQKIALADVRRFGNRLPPDAGADRFIYKVEIGDDANKEVFRVPESHFPAALRRIKRT